MTLPMTRERLAFLRSGGARILTAREAEEALTALESAIAERDALRLLFDLAIDVELRNGLWLEKRDGKWDVHRGVVTLVAGATTDYAVRYVMGGAGCGSPR